MILKILGTVGNLASTYLDGKVEVKKAEAIAKAETRYPTKTRFYKFFSGDGTNDESSDLGGSYGYGKSVYTDNSLIRTILVYSCSKEKDGSYITKLMGITKSAPYIYEGKKYTGYIYHADEFLQKFFDFETTPFRNEDADRIAQKLGFTKRDRSEKGTGTSIAIVGLKNKSHAFFQDLKESAEKYWWKKIVDNDLDIDFINPLFL